MKAFSYLCRQNNASHHVKRTGTNQKKFVGRTLQARHQPVSEGRVPRERVHHEVDVTHTIAQLGVVEFVVLHAVLFLDDGQRRHRRLHRREGLRLPHADGRNLGTRQGTDGAEQVAEAAAHRQGKGRREVRRIQRPRAALSYALRRPRGEPGGATARPFITHHNALDIPMYLRIADELYLKRLIVGGFEGVYEFSRNFRNEGMDRTHNPEFTCLEIYVAYKDYLWMMDYTEEMIHRCVMDVLGKETVKVGDNEISFKRPFKRITMIDSIKEKTGIDITGMDETQLCEVCKQLGIEVDETMGKGKLIDEIFGEKCEGTYIQPTFITDYPVEMSPLCKRHRNNPELTERFELMVNGKELANAYTELNDPIDQRARFEEQMKLSERGDDEAMFIDQDFLRALEYGMPPTSGMGIGIDRFVMLLTGQTTIQEVLLFPMMRPEKVVKNATKEDFMALGMAETWATLLLTNGYNTIEQLKAEKPSALREKLNGLRKKNKLDIPALQLEDVEAWMK